MGFASLHQFCSQELQGEFHTSFQKYFVFVVQFLTLIGFKISREITCMLLYILHEKIKSSYFWEL